MAKALGVPPSYASAVERGGRPLTMGYFSRALDLLGTDKGAESALVRAASENISGIEIALQDLDSEARQVVVVFATKIESMSDKQLAALRQALSS